MGGSQQTQGTNKFGKKMKQVSGSGAEQQSLGAEKDKSSSVSDQSVGKQSSEGAQPVMDPKYRNVICFNCGEPGHFVGLCKKDKCCFICSKPGHHMDACPEWYKPMPMA